MLKIKFSKKWWAKKKRIQNLPSLSTQLIFAVLKKDALTMVKNYKQGIKTGSFGLEKLEDGTIVRKRRLGYSQPGTPLYGKGEEIDDKTYINMLRIKKLKNGWKVHPSWAKHHTSGLKLRDLFIVHEYGTLITRGDTLIRIPPRPAFLKAYQKTLKDRRIKENTKDVKAAMTGHVNDGKQHHFDMAISRLKKGLQRYENRGR